jgi:outer membrane protein, multidrug efflux system
MKSMRGTTTAHVNLTLIVMLAFILSSCVLYKPYKRHAEEMPDQWRVSASETSTVTNVRWWEQLDDPVLNALIEEALESNYDLKAATTRIAEFQARLGVVSSQLFPQLTAQGTASRQRASQTSGLLSLINGIPVPLTISPFSNLYQGTFNLSYEIDIWGRIQSATDASLAELLAQVEVRRTVILGVVGSVSSAYIVLRQYDMQLAVSIATMKSRLESYELAKLRFVEGLTSELEVKQAASELDQAEVEVINLQTLIPQQENLISVLIGHPPRAIARGRPIDGWGMVPEIPAGIPADILEQRPDVLSAEQQIIAANARIGEARAQFLPDISLTGYYGYQSSALHNLFTDPSRVWQWAGNLLQPIFEGGRLLSNLDLTKALKCEAYYHYQQTILKALQEVNDALIAHQQSKLSLVVQTHDVYELQDYLYLARLQYENGIVDYLNVLDAERRLFQAQLDLAQIQANVYVTLVNVYMALGGGWVVDAENIMKAEWASDNQDEQDSQNCNSCHCPE